jgi:hypothetical protein
MAVAMHVMMVGNDVKENGHDWPVEKTLRWMSARRLKHRH